MPTPSEIPDSVARNRDSALPVLPLPPGRKPAVVVLEWLVSDKITNQGIDQISSVLTEPKVFIGNFRSAKDLENLKANNIGLIVSLSKIENEKIGGLLGRSDLDKFFRENGIKRIRRFISDDDAEQSKDILRLYKNFSKLCFVASKANKGLLIHCAAGCSRSPAIVCAFVAKEIGITFRKAVEYIGDFRNISIDQGLAINICRVLDIEIE